MDDQQGARLKGALKRWVPAAVYRPVVGRWRYLTRTRVTGDFLDRDRPVSETWGLDRGTPIDRWYTERFLERNSHAIQGEVLEMADPRYTRRFGGNRVGRSDVLHLIEGNPEATLVGDLVTGEGVPRDRYDCILVINTFPIIFEVERALRTCHSALKPGGVMLANFHGIYPRVPDDPAWRGDYWRFTADSVERLLQEAFGNEAVVEPAGNVRSAAAYLYGLAAEELGVDVLEQRDDRYEVVINALVRR